MRKDLAHDVLQGERVTGGFEGVEHSDALQVAGVLGPDGGLEERHDLGLEPVEAEVRPQFLDADDGFVAHLEGGVGEALEQHALEGLLVLGLAALLADRDRQVDDGLAHAPLLLAREQQQHVVERRRQDLPARDRDELLQRLHDRDFDLVVVAVVDEVDRDLLEFAAREVGAERARHDADEFGQLQFHVVVAVAAHEPHRLLHYFLDFGDGHFVDPLAHALQRDRAHLRLGVVQQSVYVRQQFALGQFWADVFLH